MPIVEVTASVEMSAHIALTEGDDISARVTLDQVGMEGCLDRLTIENYRDRTTFRITGDYLDPMITALTVLRDRRDAATRAAAPLHSDPASAVA